MRESKTVEISRIVSKRMTEYKTSQRELVSTVVSEIGGSHSSKLAIDLWNAQSDEIFKWLVASVLLSSISNEGVAVLAYQSLERTGLLRPLNLLVCNWKHLMEVLEKDSPIKHTYKVAVGLQVVAWSLDRQYEGDLNRLHFFAKDKRDLRQRLRSLGTAVTQSAATLFLIEMREQWDKVEIPMTRNAILALQNLGLVSYTDRPASILETLRGLWGQSCVTGERFCDLESALDKLGKRYCSKMRCCLCKFNDTYCLRGTAA